MIRTTHTVANGQVLPDCSALDLASAVAAALEGDEEGEQRQDDATHQRTERHCHD
jgi:hypothetical protein